ncbi:unnamed protein product [Pedinophyceae sp. YPF-701]|nr:unnamed protein product [Pedinophyceae sp. YPF-701]
MTDTAVAAATDASRELKKTASGKAPLSARLKKSFKRMITPRSKRRAEEEMLAAEADLKEAQAAAEKGAANVRAGLPPKPSESKKKLIDAAEEEFDNLADDTLADATSAAATPLKTGIPKISNFDKAHEVRAQEDAESEDESEEGGLVENAVDAAGEMIETLKGAVMGSPEPQTTDEATPAHTEEMAGEEAVHSTTEQAAESCDPVVAQLCNNSFRMAIEECDKADRKRKAKRNAFLGALGGALVGTGVLVTKAIVGKK